jgi:opacity protein-like surface antigen
MFNLVLLFCFIFMASTPAGESFLQRLSVRAGPRVSRVNVNFKDFGLPAVDDTTYHETTVGADLEMALDINRFRLPVQFVLGFQDSGSLKVNSDFEYPTRKISDPGRPPVKLLYVKGDFGYYQYGDKIITSALHDVWTTKNEMSLQRLSGGFRIVLPFRARIQPYFSAKIGLGRMELQTDEVFQRDAPFNPYPVSTDELVKLPHTPPPVINSFRQKSTVMAAALGGGVSFNINSRLNLTLDYEYFRMGAIKGTGLLQDARTRVDGHALGAKIGWSF